MKKGAIILIFLIFLTVILDVDPIISAIDCTPSWNCTSWSPCYNNLQIKRCIDLNLCGSDLNRPIERQTCGSDCIPNWECTQYTPEKCDKTLLQKRTCSDSNSCNTLQGKPEEAKSCQFSEDYSWIFTFIVAIVVIFIIGAIWILIKRFKRKV